MHFQILEVLYGWLLLPCVCTGARPNKRAASRPKLVTTPRRGGGGGGGGTLFGGGVGGGMGGKACKRTVIVMRHSEREDHAGAEVASPWDPAITVRVPLPPSLCPSLPHCALPPSLSSLPSLPPRQLGPVSAFM
jgi:hypothetical protein